MDKFLEIYTQQILSTFSPAGLNEVVIEMEKRSPLTANELHEVRNQSQCMADTRTALDNRLRERRKRLLPDSGRV